MVQSSSLSIGITFTNFILLWNLTDENNKFAIGLLRAVWNNFKSLLGILAGPVVLLMLDSFDTDSTSSLFAGDMKKELVLEFVRYL